MSTEAGHRYTFGSPSKGWPTFGPDGKIIKPEAPKHDLELADEPCRVAQFCPNRPVCGQHCRP